MFKERHVGGVEVQLHVFLTSAIDGGEYKKMEEDK
jgi:hypothetical protein